MLEAVRLFWAGFALTGKDCCVPVVKQGREIYHILPLYGVSTGVLPLEAAEEMC